MLIFIAFQISIKRMRGAEEYYLPRNLDVSMCKHVDFDGRSFRTVENFVYSKNASFSIEKSCLMPEDFEKHNKLV